MNATTKKLEPATLRVGDHVRLVGGPSCWLEVMETTDPALITLAAPNGVQIKAGRQTVSEISRRPRQ